MAASSTSTEKKKIQTCPTCGGPLHKDPVTGRFTRHPAEAAEPVEIIPLDPKVAPLPKRKRGLLRRRPK